MLYGSSLYQLTQKQIKIVNGTPIDAKHTHGRILKILIEEPKEAVSEKS
jgi:hypothetical protein